MPTADTIIGPIVNIETYRPLNQHCRAQEKEERMHDTNVPEEARLQASIEHSQATHGKDSPASHASPSHITAQVPLLPSLATLAVAFFAVPPDILNIIDAMGGKH
jgi:hypothetical protein